MSDEFKKTYFIFLCSLVWPCLVVKLIRIDLTFQLVQNLSHFGHRGCNKSKCQNSNLKSDSFLSMFDITRIQWRFFRRSNTVLDLSNKVKCEAYTIIISYLVNYKLCYNVQGYITDKKVLWMENYSLQRFIQRITI